MKWLKCMFYAVFLASMVIVIPSGCGSGGGAATDIKEYDEPVKEEPPADFDAAEDAAAKAGG